MTVFGKSVAKDSALLAASKGVTVVLGVIKLAIIARFLSPDGVGAFYLSMATVLFLSDLVMPQFGEAASRFVAEKKHTNREETARIISATVFAIFVFSIVLFAISRFFLGKLIVSFYQKENTLCYFNIFAIAIVLNPLNNVLLDHLKILTKFGYISAGNIARSAVDIMLLGLFFYIGFRVEGAIYAFVLALAVQLIICLFGIRKYLRLTSIKDLVNVDNDLLKFWYPICGSALIKAGAARMKTIIGGHFLSLTNLGYFEIASRAALTIFSIFRQYILVVHSYLMNAYYRNRDNFILLLNQSIKKYSLVIFPAAGLMIIFSTYFFVLMYGENYRFSATIFSILIFSEIFSSFAAFSKTIFYVKNKPIFYFWFHAVYFLIQLILVLILTPLFGAVGLAVSMVLASLSLMLTGYFLSTRLKVVIKKAHFTIPFVLILCLLSSFYLLKMKGMINIFVAGFFFLLTMSFYIIRELRKVP
ncbi:MAG: oligosaccharide flippase family protein [Candidatus Omnitrophica bacterium]|nr:oligosaccharide flippase family protein [Candidatus Omnitrophota bacterium]